MGDLVVQYYRMGIYTVADLPLFVSVGYITQVQADALTAGEEGK